MKDAVLIALLTMAAATVAQDGDQRDYGRPIDSPENRGDLAMRSAARCTIDKVPASARKVLGTEIGSDDEAKRVKALVGVARECFQPQWPAFPATAFRDAMAEVTYRQAHRTEPAVTAGPPPASFGVVAADQAGTPQQEAARAMAAIANCAVYAGAPAAHKWVIGPRNVDEEQRRFGLLQPAIAKCVAPGQAAALTARNFRGPVAAALLARADKK